MYIQLKYSKYSRNNTMWEIYSFCVEGEDNFWKEFGFWFTDI